MYMRINTNEAFAPSLPARFLESFTNRGGNQAFPDFNMAGGLVVNQRFTGFFLHHEKAPLLRDDGGNGGDGGDSEDQVEGGGRVPRNDREELQRRMDALENWKQDPNSSVLLDPAAVGVVRAPTARVDEIAGAGPSRASRQRLKCPVPGCQVTRASQEALNAHIENSHD